MIFTFNLFYDNEKEIFFDEYWNEWIKYLKDFYYINFNFIYVIIIMNDSIKKNNVNLNITYLKS